MGSSDEPSVHDLMAQVQQQKEAIDKLKDLPALVQQLVAQAQEHVEGASNSLPFTVSMVKTPDGSVRSDSQSMADNDSDEGLKELLNGAQNDVGDNTEDGELEEEISDILADVEKGVEFGLPLTDHVAKSFIKTVARPLQKETATKLRENLRIPENCKEFQAPKMNPEVWRSMPSHARVEDLRKQQLQAVMSTSLSALASIADIITKNCKEIPSSVKTDILKTTIDAANLLGDQFQDLNCRRRKDVRKFISPQYASICSKSFSPSEFLFGNDLEGSLRASKTESQLFRRTEGSGHRYSPYGPPKRGSGSSSTSLNFQRPTQPFPRRGTWNSNRGKGVSHNNVRYCQQQSNQPRRFN